MKVTVLAVGRVRGPLAKAVEEYEARASHYWKLELVEVDAGSRRGQTPEAVRTAEAERILARAPTDAQLVALTREGRGVSSRALADYLSRLSLQGEPGVAFLIGGAYGLSEEVLGRAHRRLSLSSMTLPHEMARLLLAEQLYRAGAIGRGEPYHKGP